MYYFHLYSCASLYSLPSLPLTTSTALAFFFPINQILIFPSPVKAKHLHKREMVGLSIVLEAQKGTASSLTKRSPQVINKATMTKPTQQSSTSSRLGPSFLDKCFLCRKKLSPAKDIYMYKGDKGFCSEECRCRQIQMDEEDQTAAFMTSKKKTYNVNKTTNCSSYYSSSTSKTTRNRAF